MDEPEEAPKSKKRKLTKAAEAKLKAKAKAKAKKSRDDDDYNEDEDDEDAYTALVKDSYKSTRPPVGSFENCAKCKQQFTVVCSLQGHRFGRLDVVSRPGIPWLRYHLQDSYATSVQNPPEPTLSRNLLLRGSVKRLRTNARSLTSRS